MLTGDLVRPRLRQRGDQLTITLLPHNSTWQRRASELIELFQDHQEQPRHQWDDALETYIGDSVEYIVYRGLAKVLTDAATFTPPYTPLAPAELRSLLFAQGPVFEQADLFHQQNRAALIEAFAADVGTTAEVLEATLFADRPSAQLLTDPGPTWIPDDLIARYNLELARGVLYWSDRMVVEIYDGFKDFWRYLKLFKLMFWALRNDDGYRVELDGPISPFVHATTRYGRQFAAFLPALLLGERWQMSATVRPPQFDQTLRYSLDNTTTLKSHFKASGMFDSQLEADFAAEFADKFGDERGQWQLAREDEVILLGDTVMIPDFSIIHKKDGRRALVEIMGFWHEEYLRRKINKLRGAGLKNMILLVYEGVNLSRDKLENVPGEVLYFINKPILKDVMAAVERVARI